MKLSFEELQELATQWIVRGNPAAVTLMGLIEEIPFLRHPDPEESFFWRNILRNKRAEISPKSYE